MHAAAVLLALASAATWGVADFSGGLVSRRLPTIPVTVLSQSAGFVALLLAFAIDGGGLDGRSFWIGILSGLGRRRGARDLLQGALARDDEHRLAARGLRRDRPVRDLARNRRAAGDDPARRSGARARGRRPRLGGGAALGGPRSRAASIALALVAAITLGLFIYFLGLGSREGSPLSTLLGARVGSLGLLGALALGRRQSLRVGAHAGCLKLAAIGLCDVAANALFALASGRGLLSLVSVLGALYPVMTVLLAHVVLGERLTARQLAGIGAALAGVAALSSG